MTANASPQTIGRRYLLHEPLGAGGMGAVYRATDRLTGEAVALKRVMLRPDQLVFASRGDGSHAALALAQEFRTLASLHHPHVIRVLDYGFDQGSQPFYTMDLLEGARTIVDAGQGQDLAKKVGLLVQALQALAYLHRRNVLHRDLKPENVLVVDGQVKVLDFGVSVTASQTMEYLTQTTAGTMAYLAPELFGGAPVTRASDLYAVGLMAYELFAGRFPYDDANMAVLFSDILTKPVDVRSTGVGAGLASVLERSLAKSREERYQDAGQVIRDLCAATGCSLPPETVEIRESYLQAAKFVGREGEIVQLAVLEASGGQWRFAHDKLRQGVLDALPEEVRPELHRQIAEAIEAIYPGVPDQVATLAYHWEHAGCREKATAYLAQAGDQARLAYAHQEAIGYYRRVLALLKEQGAYDRAGRTLMKLGLTYHSAFQFARSRQAYDECFALWQRTGESEKIALPPASGALRLPWADPTTLDPAVSIDAPSANLLGHLFSGLLEGRPAGDVVPDVAERWEIRAAGREYVFFLREDVRWSDGTRVTAADFGYAWKRVLDPATGSLRASELCCIRGANAFRRGEAAWEEVGVHALDEVTLIVELEAPASNFLQSMAGTEALPVPRHAVEAYGKAWTETERIVTNGPFLLESWKPGALMVLARNGAYHGRFTGNVERVELFLLRDREGTADLQLYKDDGVDVVRLKGTTLHRARQLRAGEYRSIPALQVEFIGFDLRRSPFNAPRVRRALALAIDRESLADVILGGYAVPATGGLVPPGVPGHSPGIGLPYDPCRARHLLAEAGYPGGKDFPAMKALAHTRAFSVCQYLQARWREELGIAVAWEFLTFDRFIDQVTRGLPQMFAAGWQGESDPASFLDVSSMQAVWEWRNKAYTGLLERARRASDQGERVKVYAQADRILVEEAGIVPLCYPREHLLIKPWVSRWPVSSTSHHFWKDAIIEPR